MPLADERTDVSRIGHLQRAFCFSFCTQPEIHPNLLSSQEYIFLKLSGEGLTPPLELFGRMTAQGQVGVSS